MIKKLLRSNSQKYAWMIGVLLMVLGSTVMAEDGLIDPDYTHLIDPAFTNFQQASVQSAGITRGAGPSYQNKKRVVAARRSKLKEMSSRLQRSKRFSGGTSFASIAESIRHQSE